MSDVPPEHVSRIVVLELRRRHTDGRVVGECLIAGISLRPPGLLGYEGTIRRHNDATTDNAKQRSAWS